jgi:hypothetical protein
VSYQAQAFNFIRSLDPYHAITGAVNCGSSYQFSEVPSTPVAPTTDLSLPVILFGTQPATQLSLDYPMHVSATTLPLYHILSIALHLTRRCTQENYGGNLAVKAGDGTWTHGQGGDGRFRNGMPFEPICNCPGAAANWGSIGITGQEEKLLSESWIGAVVAGMLDVLVFIEGGKPSTDAVMYNYARQAAEIGPSFRGRPFGAGTALTVNATALGAPTSPPTGTRRVGGEAGWRLRADVWEEPAAAPAVICAHVVVVNLDMSNPLLFTFELGGRAPPVSAEMFKAQRIFGAGKSSAVTTADGRSWLPVQAWLAPSETGIYRVGCELAKRPPANATNIATPIEASPALRSIAGWGIPAYGGVDPLVRMVSDATVAAEGRHSVKVHLPSSTPLVLPFPGRQLAAPPPLVHWGMNGTVHIPIGYPVVANSVTLLPAHTYLVSLAVQATPPGTTVELLGGLWHIEKAVVKEMAPYLRCIYTGETLGKLIVGGGGGGGNHSGGGGDGGGATAWQELSATVVVPAIADDSPRAPAWNNGTALQLRITPPYSKRGWGATVWFDMPSVVDVANAP